MNEIKKCSIAGIGFRIEKPAYECLNTYLSALNDAYANNNDRNEIISDIETRIAELILSAQSNTEQVVCLPLIKNIISQLGSADDISGHELPKEKHTFTRRLYRDLEGAKLGGVCAGLGRYFNIDTSIIRILVFAPLILLIFSQALHCCVSSAVVLALSSIFGNLALIMVVLYVIMWFAIPAATTTLHKLEMEGEPITAQTIADKSGITDEQNAKSSLASFVALLGRVSIVVLKLLVGIMIIPFVMAIILLIVGIFAISTENGLSAISLNGVDPLQALTDSGLTFTAILALVAILIPVVFLLYLFIVLLLGRKPRLWVFFAMMLLWITSIFGTFIAAVSLGGNSSVNEVSRIMSPNAVQHNITDASFDEYQQLINAENAESIDL